MRANCRRRLRTIEARLWRERGDKMARAAGDRYDVIVVGGGPVGHAVAIELGRRGITCALLERRRSPQRIPKGQNLTQRSLEHFARWGCVDELRARRVLPPGYPIGGIVCYGDLTSDYWHAPVGREAVGAYFSQPNERLPQYETEAVLRERVAQIDAVTTRYGWQVDSLDQDDDGVSVGVVDLAEPGSRQTLAGRFVVGCDGARSLVRTEAGIDRSSGVLWQKMVLAVLRSRELHQHLKRFPERTTYRAMHPDAKGYWRFFGRVDVGESFFFHAPVPSDTASSRLEVRRHLEEAAGFSFAYELDHVGLWDLRIEVAQEYRARRAFIAGDACHSHPPYYGYGLNTGLEDATNLAWKLAAVLEGWGGEALLDTYTIERQPIFEEIGREIITAGIERDRAFLDRYRPERDLAEFEEAWEREMAIADTGPQWYEPHYEGSPIVDGPPEGRCSVHGSHSFQARPGHHLAPRRLSDGTNAFCALGDGFSLLAFGAPASEVAAIETAAKAASIPLTTCTDDFQGERADYGARLILVRPDEHVAWVGENAPRDPRRLLERLVGR
jgi:2-polyprenyl-6-methoxyphenol hydroxylase-like FAD-dependent oxidoreductase